MESRWQYLLQTHSGLFVGSITALLAFIVYWFTLAPDITWANYGVDGGDLITAVVTRGNPHPSGYPSYLILGYLVNTLPFEPIALRFNLFSALTMACAVGLIAAATLPLTYTETEEQQKSAPLISISVGLSLAFASLVWGQAVITEVYSLFLLFCAAYLWSLLTQKPAWLTGFFCGLAITAHTTGWLLLPLAFVFTPRRKMGHLVIGILCGLIPFLLLPFLITSTSPVIWGDLSTIQGWWWLVSSQIYRGYGFSLPPNLWVPRLLEWAPIWGTQFSWIGLPLIIISLFLVKSKFRRLYLLLLGTAVLYFIIAFFYNTNDAIIFTLPAWLLLSLLLIPAFKKLGWISLLLPLTLILINFQTNNLKNNYQVRQNAELLLKEVPEKAIVETPGDPTIFTLWYIIYAEEKRNDIIPVDNNLFAFDWYRNRLSLIYPDLSGLDQDNMESFRRSNQQTRPYCFGSLAQNEPNSLSNYSLTCLENTNP